MIDLEHVIARQRTEARDRAVIAAVERAPGLAQMRAGGDYPRVENPQFEVDGETTGGFRLGDELDGTLA